MKVAIAYCANDMVPAKFAAQLATLHTYSMLRGLQVLVICQETSLVPKGRHDAVKEAIKACVDGIFFLDTDMLVPMDILDRFASSGKSIIGLNYPTRRGAIRPLCRDLNGCPVAAGKGIEEVSRLGAGALFVKTSVFESIGPPYFHIGWDAEKQQHISEDYWFCDQVRDAGFSVFCDHDTSAVCSHAGVQLKEVECSLRLAKK